MNHTYEEIISLKNLAEAWEEFVLGKKRKADVQEFSLSLLDHITGLHDDLATGAYRHGGYHRFSINDPKPRDIHKATVRDRLVHHAIYRVLYPYFDRLFIVDSFSCRQNKGTHKALERFAVFARKVGRNDTRTVWVLKCDIRKFFASIDHATLMDILRSRIPDPHILGLLENIIASYRTTPQNARGLPLGNLTSQLFSNIYLNIFDQWVKHGLHAEDYIRYADDFVFLSPDREWLCKVQEKVDHFLRDHLKLTLHPYKVFLTTLSAGVDFLGWVHFPHHRVLRTKTKRRMFTRIKNFPIKPVFQSYYGLLQHGNAKKLTDKVRFANWLQNE